VKLNPTMWLDMQDLTNLADYLNTMYDIKVSPQDFADRDSFGVCNGAFVLNVVEKIRGLGFTLDAALKAVRAAVILSQQQKGEWVDIDSEGETH